MVVSLLISLVALMFLDHMFSHNTEFKTENLTILISKVNIFLKSINGRKVTKKPKGVS